MFSRAVKLIPANAHLPATYLVPTRGMVTEKQLKNRIASVVSIKKITSAMKVVAAVKLRSSQNRLDVSRKFSQDIEKVWEPKAEEEEAEDLVVAISADRGLCGAVNSNISRAVRDDVKGGSQKILLFGEKARPGLERMFGNRFTSTVSNLGNNRPISFRNAALLADIWIGEKFDKSILYYNYFRNMISFVTTKVPFLGFEKANEDVSEFYQYEIEGDIEVMQNLYEFKVAVSMFHYLCENDTSTTASRLNAMDSSSKNAGEMIDDLTMKMNRARQAKITTELIEIMSGASAVDEQSK